MTDTPTIDTPEVDTYADNVSTGAEENKWYSSLNEEYRNHPSIQKFTDANGLAKSYLGLESLMGRDKVPVPKGADDLTAWGLYNKAFNVPENVQGYDLKIEGAEDLNLDSVKELMLKYHIPNETAQALLNAHVEDIMDYERHKTQEADLAAQEATKQLKAEWGLKYDENLKNARTFLEKMSDSKEQFDYFNNKIGNDVNFIKLLSKMGSSISEGSLGGFEGQVGGFTKTPAEAKAELDRIMNDPSDAYWAGSMNRRNDAKYCKEHNLTFVSEEERKARVAYVNSLMQMQG